MHILVVADEPDKGLWELYQKEKIKRADLILSCGDLPAEYLEFLVTIASCPLLYIHGNHDDRYDSNPPGGCFCIEDQVYTYKGLRILGLGGSMRYKPGGHMYTEREMRRRLRHPRLMLRLMKSRGFDILITHAPARGYGDLEDLPHRGFECFNRLLERYKPKFMFYGHVHQSYGHFVRTREHPSGTKLINAGGSYELVLEPETNEQQSK